VVFHVQVSRLNCTQIHLARPTLEHKMESLPAINHNFVRQWLLNDAVSSWVKGHWMVRWFKRYDKMNFEGNGSGPHEILVPWGWRKETSVNIADVLAEVLTQHLHIARQKYTARPMCAVAANNDVKLIIRDYICCEKSFSCRIEPSYLAKCSELIAQSCSEV
jgi:hypothetical protein